MVLAGVIVALVVCLVFLLPERIARSPLAVGSPPVEPEARQMLIDELITRTPAAFDSHPDQDVGRVGMPSKEWIEAGRSGERVAVRTNSHGMRDEEYPLPKPAGLTRIVLLGDSFVFGMGVAEEQRTASCLEEILRAHLSGNGNAEEPIIECLSLGVPSWGIT
jgi:hypothetical protein